MELWRCLTQTGRSYKCITLSQANCQSHLSVTQMSSDKGMQLLSAVKTETEKDKPMIQ